MERIDLLGAPGVGKSSLLNYLINKSHYHSQILKPDKAKVILAKEYIKAFHRRYIYSFISIIFKLCTIPRIRILLANEILKNAEDVNLWNERDQYKAFFDNVLDIVASSKKDPIITLFGINQFFNVSKYTFLLESSKQEGVVLFDESLSQKVYGVANCGIYLDHEAIKKYFTYMPLPKCLVYCYLDLENLLDRIKKRNKIILPHRNLSEEQLRIVCRNQLEVASIGKEILESRGCNIIQINMKDELVILSEKLNEELKLLLK